MVINIYSLLWHKNFLYTKLADSIAKFHSCLLQFSVRTTDGPAHVETSFPREHIHRHHSDSCCNPSAQIGKGLYPLAVHDVFRVLQKKTKSVCVKSELRGGKLISLSTTNLSTRKWFIQRSAYSCTKMGFSY
jgi:hypothetical protein